MQKKLIALAVAGLVSGSAFAQTNVTIYGGLDMSFARIDPKVGSASNHVLSNGVYTSRIGFKGTEDLGNGLKAGFVLENGLTPDAPTDAFGTTVRQSYVSLSGGFGEVAMGHMSHFSHLWSGTYDYAGNFVGAIVGGLRTAATSDGVSRYGNTVRFTSPNFSGFTVGFAHSPDEVGGSSADRNQMAAKYDQGPLNVTYTRTTIGAGVAPGTKKTANWLAGAYDFGAVKLTGEYTDVKADGAAKKGSMLMVGAIVPVSAVGKVHVGYTKAKTAADDAAGLSDKSLSLAYTHSLSKRTTAYAGLMRDSGNSALQAERNVFAGGLIHAF